MNLSAVFDTWVDELQLSNTIPLVLSNLHRLKTQIAEHSNNKGNKKGNSEKTKKVGETKLCSLFTALSLFCSNVLFQPFTGSSLDLFTKIQHTLINKPRGRRKKCMGGVYGSSHRYDRKPLEVSCSKLLTRSFLSVGAGQAAYRHCDA